MEQAPDVFEMILKSVDNGSSVVHATPSTQPEVTKWQEPEEEGELAVDVADTGDEILVLSTMAGADPDRIEVFVHNDLLTIRGVRTRPIPSAVSFFHEECFWGPFSRTVVLPVDVKGDRAKAEYKSGVLVVTIPKQKTDAQIPVVVVEE